MPRANLNKSTKSKTNGGRKSQNQMAGVSTRAKKNVKANSVVLNYRLRTPDDDAYILQLTREQLGQVHTQAFGEPFPEQQFLQYIQSGAPTYIIEHQGKRIGYYSYLIGPDMKMHVSALVIEPKLQASGLGKQVMTQLEKEAKAQGVQVLEVFVQSTNPNSIAFTKSLGFTEVFRMEPNTIGFQKRISQFTQVTT